MADYFALLNEPRRPWIDPEVLKAAFVALTSKVHPDRVHSLSAVERDNAHRRFTDLNTGYSCLRDPRKRLAHLLELELDRKPENVREIPAGIVGLFEKVGAAGRQADAFLSDKGRIVSPLLKVRLLEQADALTDRIQSILRELNAGHELLVLQLKGLNETWASAPPVGSAERRAVLPCDRLEQVYHEVSYLTRWIQQMQERLTRLAI